jgi:hypothetical protein
MFKPDELKAKLDEVAQNLGDQAKVTTILSEITTDYATTHGEFEASKTTVETTLANMEIMRKANMELFLKLGSTPATNTQTKPVDNTPKVEDLFDEKGNLK